MKVGPFGLLKEGLVVLEAAEMSAWESGARRIFEFQKSAPWWIGDLCVFGEAQWGEEFWQAIPADASHGLIDRCTSIARKVPQEERFPSLSFTHHVTAMRIKSPPVRNAMLRLAEQESMSSDEFRDYIKEHVNA